MSRVHFSNYDVFKSLAKKVQKGYKANPDIETPLPLGTIRSVCAYGMGYINDHDLKKSITPDRHDDLALLPAQKDRAIFLRLDQLEELNDIPIATGTKTEWKTNIIAISESLREHLDDICLQSFPLHVMTVRFLWPFSGHQFEFFDADLIDDVLSELKELTQKDWQFLPTCSKRNVPTFLETVYEEPYIEWDDLEGGLKTDFLPSFERFTSNFASDFNHEQGERFLSTGVQAGNLIFATPVTWEEYESQDTPEATDVLIKSLRIIINQLVGERSPWVSVMPPVFSFVANETYEHNEFYWVEGSQLQTVAASSDSPEEIKVVPLMANNSIVGRIEFNNQRADVYLPNYDTIFNEISDDYNYMTEMYSQASSEIGHLCRDLKVNIFAHPSWDVWAEDLMEDEDIIELRIPEKFNSPKKNNWVLEAGNIISCPRYLKGKHCPDWNTELMNIDEVPKPGESFLESQIDSIKDLKPTTMSAIAYIEAVEGGYFHVIASIFSGEELVAEESYSVYGGISKKYYHNGLFAKGDALYDRLARIADTLGIQLSATSSENTYYSAPIVEDGCYAFGGTNPEKVRDNNRHGILLTVLHHGTQQPLTTDQSERILESVKKGLLSPRIWDMSKIEEHFHWGIDRHIRYTAIPFKLGMYEEHLDNYCRLLRKSSLKDSKIEIDPFTSDRFPQQGPFCIGLAFDGPEVMTEEIFIDWGRMAMAEPMAAAFSGKEANFDAAPGAIPKFYAPMEKELYKILELDDDAKIFMTFNR